MNQCGKLLVVVRPSLLWERGDDFSDKVITELSIGDYLIQISQDPDDSDGSIEVIAPCGQKGFVWYDSISKI